MISIHPALTRFSGTNSTQENSYMPRLVKAVYGTVLAAIIFYNKLSKHLTDHGFVMNEYDMCTFNKMVDGEQLTVQFHVNDLKASHKDQKVLDGFLDNLRTELIYLVRKMN